jgi:hypothetical protein
LTGTEGYREKQGQYHERDQYSATATTELAKFIPGDRKRVVEETLHGQEKIDYTLALLARTF